MQYLQGASGNIRLEWLALLEPQQGSFGKIEGAQILDQDGSQHLAIATLFADIGLSKVDSGRRYGYGHGEINKPYAIIL